MSIKVAQAPHCRSFMPGVNWAVWLSLPIASLASTSMLLARVMFVRQVFHMHLLWNLFLAWIPVILALMAWRARHRRVLLVSLGFLWLIFLPNAPYLVTDLIHLRAAGGVPIWYDAVMLFSFALVGVALGLQSLHLMQGLVSQRLGVYPGWLFVAVVSLLSGLGVYIGRFLRWNSWDLFLHPTRLVADVLADLTSPHALLKLLVVVSLFSFITAFGYALFPPGTQKH